MEGYDVAKVGMPMKKGACEPQAPSCSLALGGEPPSAQSEAQS